MEQLWGISENHWRGELLPSIGKTLGLARSMTYKGNRPNVRKITKVYKAGVSLTIKAMREIEQRMTRKKGLESWFTTISPDLNLG